MSLTVLINMVLIKNKACNDNGEDHESERAASADASSGGDDNDNDNLTKKKKQMTGKWWVVEGSENENKAAYTTAAIAYGRVGRVIKFRGFLEKDFGNDRVTYSVACTRHEIDGVLGGHCIGLIYWESLVKEAKQILLTRPSP